MIITAYPRRWVNYAIIKLALYTKASFGMKKNKGFSLMELLVVAGILGLLAIIGSASYERYKQRVNASSGLQTIGQFNQKYLAFAMENDRFPTLDELGYELTPSTPTGQDSSTASSTNTVAEFNQSSGGPINYMDNPALDHLSYIQGLTVNTCMGRLLYAFGGSDMATNTGSIIDMLDYVFLERADGTIQQYCFFTAYKGDSSGDTDLDTTLPNCINYGWPGANQPAEPGYSQYEAIWDDVDNLNCVLQ